MLSRLQVRNYVLIDSLDIEFPEGLVIITGQTGAGKSILLGALNLLLGGRSDVSAIAEGADRCIVEAQFSADPGDEALKTVFEENELDWDEGNITVRRMVSRNGRSRAFVNDIPVSVQTLSQLAARLVDIHSQHQTMLLSDRRYQLSILDRYAGDREQLDACAAAWKRLEETGAVLKDLQEQLASAERDRDFNEAQLKRLEEAALKDGELEELEEEQKKLANAEEIKSLLCECLSLSDMSSSDVEMSIANSLKEIQKRLERLSAYIPSSAALAERLESVRYEVEDVMSDVETLNEGLDVSEERLQFVDDRLSLLYSLLKKYGVATVAELIAYRDSLSSLLSDSSELRDRIVDMEKEKEKAAAEFSRAAESLHEVRAAAALRFSDEIRNSIRSLEMPLADFAVVLEEQAAGPSGSDSISFTFSATGRNRVDIARCASGGELSRIMLSLKDLMARYCNMPVMIFDEIDTGVSGSVADKMGSMICSMGSTMQVFAITHLPQVAAKGKAHYLVTKSVESDGRTVSRIEKLSEERRVLELARMLSGSVLTDAAVANARELLGIN